MKNNIIKINETFYNLYNIIQFKIWRTYIDLLFSSGQYVRVEDEINIDRVKRYFEITTDDINRK